MKYELDFNESPDEGIKRIILERVDYVHDQMVDPQPTREKAVHEARKSFKRIRGALRLVRDETGEQWYGRENIFYRDASRILAPVRDSTVLVLTLDAVTEDFPDIVTPETFASIRHKLVERHDEIVVELLDNQDVMADVARRMEEGRERLLQMPVSGSDFSLFEGGMRRVYHRGRQAMHAAYAAPEDPANFHDWRKRVKYLWHHVEILGQVWPVVMVDLGKELHLASDALGDAHDLVELNKTLLTEPERFADEAELPTLLDLSNRRRRGLEEASRTLGQRLYFERPQDFVGRIEAYWNAWQEDLPVTREALQSSVITREQIMAELAEAELLSTEQAADLLGTTPARIRSDIHAGKLEAVKIGRLWVIRRDSLPKNPQV